MGALFALPFVIVFALIAGLVRDGRPMKKSDLMPLLAQGLSYAQAGWRKAGPARPHSRKVSGAWTPVQFAEKVIEFIEAGKPDATVVDGDGLGAGVVDQLRHRGYGERLFEFHGGARALDPDKYFNRRAECWGLLGEWLAAKAEIPDESSAGRILMRACNLPQTSPNKREGRTARPPFSTS